MSAAVEGNEMVFTHAKELLRGKAINTHSNKGQVPVLGTGEQSRNSKTQPFGEPWARSAEHSRKAHDVSEHDHLVRILGEDGLVQHNVDVLVIALREKPHSFDVSVVRNKISHEAQSSSPQWH